MFEHSSASDTQAAADERLRTLGLLAGRIAHDLNNLLTPLSASASLLRMPLKQDSREARILMRIEHCALRASDFVRKLSDYASAESLSIQSINLNAVIEQVEEAMRLLSASQVELEYVLHPKLPDVRASQAGMQRALLLLATGAVESMADIKSPKVTITTGVSNPLNDGLRAVIFDHDMPATCAFAEVSDNGPAPSADLLDDPLKIFQRDKTNARVLGLPVSCEVARELGGLVKIGTGNGRGYTVRMYLPLSETSDSDE